MLVTSLTLWAHELEMAVPYAYSGGELTHATTLILRLTTDTGLTGWGESCPLGPTYQPAHALGGVAAIQEMAPAILGQPALPRPLSAAMNGALEGHAYAKALRAYGQAVITDTNGTDHNWREELIDTLAARIGEDGSWVNTEKRWYEADPLLVTAYGVLALEETVRK